MPECHHLSGCQVFAVRLVYPVVLGTEGEYKLVVRFMLDRTQLFKQSDNAGPLEVVRQRMLVHRGERGAV